MTLPDAAPPVPPPTFDALPLSPEVRKAIDLLGYTHPTPVQRAVFEPAVRGKNLVVQARTGTGKTAAFGLPIVDSLVKKSLAKVQALILTPTRELALQVGRELEQLSQFKGITVTPIYGGAPMGKQIEALAGGTHIVSGTPGRVLDHLRRGTLDPSNIRIFVLDEADEMLSMGFAKELHAIAGMLPKDRQGLFFSATIPPDIERMAHAQLKDPEFVTLSSDQVGALEVAHYVYMLRGGDKRQELIKIIEVENPESAVIFCNTKDETERMAEALQNKGYDAEWLNGDLEQSQRERIMAKTREGKLRFLVATDVAARGIDISHLTHVINADFPEQAEGYVHRTGRTGRAGRTGTAISIVGPKDIGNLYILRLTYKIRPIERQIATPGELKTRAEHDVVALFAEAFAARPANADDLALARRLLTHADAEKIVAGLVRDHLGTRPGDPATEAAEARRARNPPPLGEVARDVAPQSREAAAPRAAPRRDGRPARDGRDVRDARRSPARSLRDESASTAEAERGPKGARGRVPHSSFATWEPPVEVDDDKPILNEQAAGARTMAHDTELRPPPPSLPKYTTSEAPPVIVERTDPPSAFVPAERSGSSGPEDDPVGFTQIFVNVGRRDGVRAEDFQRLLVDQAGISKTDTGPVRIRDRISFVCVRKETLDRAVAALTGQTLGGRSVVAEPAKQRVG